MRHENQPSLTGPTAGRGGLGFLAHWTPALVRRCTFVLILYSLYAPNRTGLLSGRPCGTLRFHIAGHRIFIENQDVNTMISVAYAIHQKQIVGAPAWCGTDRYDIAYANVSPTISSLFLQRAFAFSGSSA